MSCQLRVPLSRQSWQIMSSTCVTIVNIQTYRKTGRFIFWDAQYHIFYLEFTIFLFYSDAVQVFSSTDH